MSLDALLFSADGIYAPVRIENDKHAYSGEVVLAPRGKSKAIFDVFDWDVSFRHLALDYSQQTRSYMIYSDFGDPRFRMFYYDDGDPINDYSKYMTNSIMHLEDIVHSTTIANFDTHYDSIVPYMVYGDGTFVPVLQFADSDGSLPVPEFYDGYPIFLSPDHYNLIDEEYLYHSIYKIYNGSTNIIQLIPKFSTHTLYSDIVSFDAYLCDEQGEIITSWSSEYFDSFDSFTFNKTSGQIILSPQQVSELDTYLVNYGSPSAYIVLEFFIEKYRSIDDLGDFTAEEVQDIAAMQSAHANILEYMYQHTIATKTQQKLSEAAYTVLVTVVSTLPFAIGAGIAAGASSGVTKGLYTLPKMLISESLEELFIDPWIESYVSGYAEEKGWNMLGKALAVSFAESGRETFVSSVTRGVRKMFTLESRSQSQAQLTQSARQLKAERKAARRQALSQSAISTLMLFAGAISPVAIIFSAYATQIGLEILSAIPKVDQKELLEKIIDLQTIDMYSEENVQNLLGILSPSQVADPQTALLHNRLNSIAN